MTEFLGVRGGGVRFHRYRGENLRTLACNANVRNVRMGVRTPAHLQESTTFAACGPSVCGSDLNVRRASKDKSRPHTEKRTLSKARADFDRTNLEAARIIAADPERY